MTEKSPFKKGRKSKRIETGKWESILEKELASRTPGRMDRIFASSAGLCERQVAGQYFLPKGYERVRQASTEFYFRIGSVFEDIVAKAFGRADIFVDRETRVEAYHKDLPVSGRIDFTIRDPDDGSLVLVELKSCGKLPERPKPQHEAQLMTYLTLTGMPKGIIWYISRSVAGWGGKLIQKTFELEPTKEQKWSTIFRTAFGAIAASHHILPEIPDHMKRYKCGFCPLIPYCWEDDDALLEDFSPIDATEEAELIKRATKIANDVIKNQGELQAQYEELMGV